MHLHLHLVKIFLLIDASFRTISRFCTAHPRAPPHTHTKDRQTDRPRYSVCCNRLHLMHWVHAIRPKNEGCLNIIQGYVKLESASEKLLGRHLVVTWWKLAKKALRCLMTLLVNVSQTNTLNQLGKLYCSCTTHVAKQQLTNHLQIQNILGLTSIQLNMRRHDSRINCVHSSSLKVRTERENFFLLSVLSKHLVQNNC